MPDVFAQPPRARYCPVTVPIQGRNALVNARSFASTRRGGWLRVVETNESAETRSDRREDQAIESTTDLTHSRAEHGSRLLEETTL